MSREYDIAIVGAGPAALSFALSLAGTPLRIILLEKEQESRLANPAFDGREIALTHPSVSILKKLGVWELIPAEEISLLRNARVVNGSSRAYLGFDPESTEQEGLGYLVPNHLIRQALYARFETFPHIDLTTERQVTGILPHADGITLTTSSQETVSARLAVAADSRFSETRRMMGIAARMQDFGKTMMVCRMTHEIPHQHTAYEWFGYGQTVALLPCNGNTSSVVMTLPANQIARLMTMDEAAFNQEIEARLLSRWGRMQLVSQRFSYPLVGVYPDRFAARRFALIGDAAVGMHPVTAHGFNFGLLSQATLAAEIHAALAHGHDIGNPQLLARYERTHRRATQPLYLATQAIIGLFTNDARPARLLRDAAIRLSSYATPFGKAVSRQLSGEPSFLPPLPPPPGLKLIRKLFPN